MSDVNDLFHQSIAEMPEASRIFVDKSLAILERIRLVMDYRGISQKELADRMGKTEAEVSRFLNPMYNFTLRTLAGIEAALGESIIDPLPAQAGKKEGE